MRVVPAAAAILAILVLAAGSTAAVTGKPDVTAALKKFEEARKAESKAHELAEPATATKANEMFAHASLLFDGAVKLVAKQPVNDYDFRAFREAVGCAQSNDTRYVSDGYGSSRDEYEYQQAEECKAEAYWVLRDISERGEKPAIALDQAITDVTAAFTAEDKARDAWRKNHDAAATREQLRASRDKLLFARHVVTKAAHQGLVSTSAADAIVGDLENADLNDANASAFLDPTSPNHAQVVESIEHAIEAKDKAVSAIEHAIANPPTTKPGESPLSVTLTSVFVPADRATKYTAETKDAESRRATYTWKLRLIRIDPQGSSPPGFQSTDPKAPNYASAAFDATCNDAKLPNGEAGNADQTSANYLWQQLGNEFIWYHGDVGSYAGSTYGCDHTKMGARGHQGTVTVIVSDGIWTCRAEIYGSNLTETPDSSPGTCTRG